MTTDKQNSIIKTKVPLNFKPVPSYGYSNPGIGQQFFIQ